MNQQEAPSTAAAGVCVWRGEERDAGGGSVRERQRGGEGRGGGEDRHRNQTAAFMCSS